MKTGAGVAAGLLGLTSTSTSAVAQNDKRTSHKFLFWNTWLLDGIEFINVAGKPQYEKRAEEIGKALAENDYDIVALAEVFDSAERETIKQNLKANTDGKVSDRVGPKADGFEMSGGLYSLLVGNRSYVSSNSFEYAAEGNTWCDADAWAGKGVQHTEVDVGPGNIDVFSTHLFAGGGLPICWGGGGDRTEIRRSQIQELISFVEMNSKPENVTIVSGDFNIEDAPNEEYGFIQEMKDELGLYDAWERFGDGKGATNDAAFGGGCTVDENGEPPYYCQGNAEGEGERIDYVFVEKPKSGHTIELDVADMKRASFWRGKADPSKYADDNEEIPNYLSDHMALELEFDAVPKS
ncbi:MAG: endonuclease/exonuclease/phosphatase [Halobacteria archaeon]|nr:endonuclease/exonuclease/phosphatase [Halobacteria archaeon]